MTTQKSNTHPLKSPLVSWHLVIILLLLSAICIYDQKTLNYSVFNRTWGFDHIIFFGTTLKLLFFTCILILIVPYTNGLLVRAFSWLAEKGMSLRRFKILIFIVLSLLSVFIFYKLTIKYYFLGDFNLRMIQTMKKEFVSTEYLTMRILYHFTTLGMKYGFAQEHLFKFYSNLVGGVFIFFSFMIADLAGKTGFQKLIFFLAQVGSALLLVFCGYVEVYATPITTLALYLYFGLRYLRTGKGFIFAFLSICLAIACHALCLAALPSLALAWYFRNKHRVQFIARQPNKKLALRLSALILLSLVVALKVKSGFLLTVSAPPNQPKMMTLFHYKHFWEFFNGQVLANGLSVFFIFSLLIKSIKEKRALLSEHYFLLAVCGCFFLLTFMANLQRGSGDWDIMAFPAISLNLVTVMLIVHLFRNQQGFGSYLMIAIVGINSVNALLWVEINHTDRSIRKIETMLVNDPGTYYTARISGATQLAIAYTNNKLMAESQRAALAACNMPGQADVRPCVLYALALKEKKQFREAKIFFEDLLTNRTPYIYEAYLYLLEYYEKNNDMVGFYGQLNRFYDVFVQNPDGFTGNINFKPDFLMKLFDALYRNSIPQNDTKRLKQMQNVIEALKTFKPAKK